VKDALESRCDEDQENSPGPDSGTIEVLETCLGFMSLAEWLLFVDLIVDLFTIFKKEFSFVIAMGRLRPSFISPFFGTGWR
jgi:hypothetical protein